MTRIDVCIPSIPPRAALATRALASVEAQTRTADRVIVNVDTEHVGAAASRNAALALATAEWVAFLDDDDWFLPQHLERLLACAEETGADMVYPWFESNGTDPLFIDNEPAAFRPFDEQARQWLISRGNFIPITVLARREMLLDVGGFQHPPNADDWNPCEDWGAWRALAMADANIVHLPERTWFWFRWYGHTSGRPWV